MTRRIIPDRWKIHYNFKPRSWFEKKMDRVFRKMWKKRRHMMIRCDARRLIQREVH